MSKAILKPPNVKSRLTDLPSLHRGRRERQQCCRVLTVWFGSFVVESGQKSYQGNGYGPRDINAQISLHS